MNTKKREVLWEEILRSRIYELLPITMKKKQTQAWMILSEEGNEDPLFRYFSGYRDVGARGISVYLFIQKDSIFHGYSYRPITSLNSIYEPLCKGTESWEEGILSRIKEFQVTEVCVQCSEREPFASGLSASLWKRLISLQERNPFFSLRESTSLSVSFVASRTEPEKKWLEFLSQETQQILDEVLNLEQIRKYHNTTEIEYALIDATRKRGFTNWFSPDVDIQRKGLNQMRAFGETLQRGDLLHVDFGISDLLHTDVQKMYYLSKIGEELPQDFEKGLQKANQLQDFICKNLSESKTGNEALARTLENARQNQVEAQVYTHPLNFYGHGLGSAVGRYHTLGKGIPQGEYEIERPSFYAVESNASLLVPKWEGQRVYFFTEEDYWLGESSCYLSQRQTHIPVFSLLS